ncbi:MAG: BamA/TamA family outer membrane protein [Bryobacteraceae bacterium]|nr:BamA/TamA family outer membrane protein [Bryobacteraceae bacterium]
MTVKTGTLIFCSVLLCSGQETRTAEIERQRDEKARELKPEDVSKGERFLRDIKERKYLERVASGYNGLRAKIGNMVTGGGFALGPEYFREDFLRGQLTTRASAQFSTRGYRKYEAEAILPRLAGDHLFLNAIASRRTYRGIQYHGPGPDSSRSRTNYLLEDTSIDGIAAVKPGRFLKLGGSLGGLWVNVGPGQDSRFASSEQVFTPAQAPGIDRQTNFFRYGTFGQFDYRDSAAGPKSGGNYVMQFSWFRDQQLSLYSFRRLDIDLQQYVPFFNRSRILALRARTTLTDTDAGNLVPFYLQPFLGGSDDLRGFRPFRFSDRNSMVLNAEYRWEVFSGLDGAIFVDGGKVFPRRGFLNFRDLEGSAGFGLRFNVQNATFLRIDVGFSHEGFQVWFKFNDVFNQRRFGTTTGQPVY